MVNDGKVNSTSATVFIVASAPAPSGVTMYLYGGANSDVYIGCLTCIASLPESVCNQSGTYGGQFQTLSIWNRTGQFGASYLSDSPWTSWSFTGPNIIGSDKQSYGYFTVNTAKPGRTTDARFLNVLNYYRRTGDLSATRTLLCGN